MSFISRKKHNHVVCVCLNPQREYCFSHSPIFMSLGLEAPKNKNFEGMVTVSSSADSISPTMLKLMETEGALHQCLGIPPGYEFTAGQKENSATVTIPPSPGAQKNSSSNTVYLEKRDGLVYVDGEDLPYGPEEIPRLLQRIRKDIEWNALGIDQPAEEAGYV